jgi:hypothetical protein
VSKRLTWLKSVLQRVGEDGWRQDTASAEALVCARRDCCDQHVRELLGVVAGDRKPFHVDGLGERAAHRDRTVELEPDVHTPAGREQRGTVAQHQARLAGNPLAPSDRVGHRVQWDTAG